MRRLSVLLLAVPAALLLAGCPRSSVKDVAQAPTDVGTVSLAEVPARSGPSRSAAALATLRRGAEVRLKQRQGEFFRIVAGKLEGWIPADSFERLSEKQARDGRAAAVSKFAAQPGRALEECPILLAPEYGAARWGALEDGDDVEVVLADHDFFGIRLAQGGGLAFVPARSVRLMPMPKPTREARPTPEAVAVATPGEGSGAGIVDVPREERSFEQPLPTGPLASLPEGAEAPVLVTRVEPQYPDFARRAGIGGEVVLRIVVEVSGQVGDVEVVSGAPAGLTEAAVAAARRWVYRPARLNGRPIAVVKTLRVKFAVGGKTSPPADPAPL